MLEKIPNFREEKKIQKQHEELFQVEQGERDADNDLSSRLRLTQKEIDELGGPDFTGSTSLINFINIKDRKLAVKKGINVDSSLNAQREYAFLKLLELRGGEKVSPEPFFYKSDTHGDLLIMEKIEGEPLKNISEADLLMIAQALVIVHKPIFHKPGIPFHHRERMTQYDNLINQISFLEDWFKEISPYINNVNPSDEFSLNHLTSAKKVILKKAINSRDYFKDSSFSLIHYDLNPGNIIKRDKGGVLFLDWRQASVGDRAMDISKFFYKNYLNEEQEKLFLNYYLSEIDDTTLKARIDVYSPLIRLASLLWRLRFLNIDLKNHPRIVDGVNSELVSQRLTEDYQYLINKYYEN